MTGNKTKWEYEWTHRGDDEVKRGWHVFDPDHVDANGPVVSLEKGYDNERIARMLASAPEHVEIVTAGIDLLEGDLTGLEWKRAVNEWLSAAKAVQSRARGET